MKVIICGGRSYNFMAEDRAWLDDFHAEHVLSEVITGGAPGADICGDIWAQERGIIRVVFPANWEGEGKNVGPLRNARMLWYLASAVGYDNAECAVISFPSGKGTKIMCYLAIVSGILAYEPGASPRELWLENDGDVRYGVD